MKRRIAAVAFAIAAFAGSVDVRAQQTAPRDIWPQATAAAREGDIDTANQRTQSLVTTGRTNGILTFPQYAAGAAGLASEQRQAPDIEKWATKTAAQLDGTAPSVAFNEADRIARTSGWGKAIPVALKGFGRAFGDYRTNLLSRADLLIVAALALALTAILLAISLFFRYGRSMGHDFRELLSARMTGGSVSVIAFALLFLPLFLWLGPMWLLFYWFAIFFAYATVPERVAIVVLLLLVALLPLIMDATANRIAGVESPVVMAAISSANQAYQPEALRRLQELINVVPDHPTLQLLAGNMQAFEGNDDQAQQHYRRAIELRPNYAGALVNLGNLLFLNNEFQAALTQYDKAQKADPKLAIAFYNASVASGETYKFDQQARMLESARKANRSFVERATRTPPPQKIVMYNPPIADAWAINAEVSRVPSARALFGSYATFDPLRSAVNPVTIGALVSLLLALGLWAKRRRTGLANACIKCGRTFCFRCKSARESTTYCTQCIHIYLKRDGVSLDTKRKKLEEVTDHQSGMTRRNRIFATFLPGAAQMMEGRTVAGVLGAFLFALFVAIAVFVGRLAPALGPAADVAQMIVRAGAIALAVILWLTLSIPVYRRRSAA
ncbi:MAG TPA: tetratricopeptide repeat protein [Thermoanaerobaculia bacterium]|nr:tetratricopeptide repeat protein [Thermoanaerobaculia bacterium]